MLEVTIDQGGEALWSKREPSVSSQNTVNGCHDERQYCLTLHAFSIRQAE